MPWAQCNLYFPNINFVNLRGPTILQFFPFHKRSKREGYASIDIVSQSFSDQIMVESGTWKNKNEFVPLREHFNINLCSKVILEPPE